MVLVATTHAGVVSLPHSAWAASPWADSWGWNPTPGISQHSSIPAAHWSAPAVVAVHATPSWAQHSAHWAPSEHWEAPSAHWAAPHAAHWAAPVAAIIPHGATYKAATRGAVHEAPLPGHSVSQTSLNVAPAPGTW